MGRVMFDLCGESGERFSPYCWRARLALAHKGLEVEARGTPFTEIQTATEGLSTTVPMIDDHGHKVRDSFDIALYLEQRYTDRPSLFGGDGGKALSRLIEGWANSLHGPILRCVILDIHDRLAPADRAYFRQSRENRFGGQTLEAIQADREAQREIFRAGLTPMRLMLAKQPFIGGDAPLFADHILFGTLQWPRMSSDFAMLEDDDPVADWFGRCLDLYDGLGRNAKA